MLAICRGSSLIAVKNITDADIALKFEIHAKHNVIR